MYRRRPEPKRTAALFPSTTLFRSSIQLGSSLGGGFLDFDQTRALRNQDRALTRVGHDLRFAPQRLLQRIPLAERRVGPLERQEIGGIALVERERSRVRDRKSTRLNSRH